MMIYRFAILIGSQDEGEHSLSSLRVLISKLLLVPSVLLDCPLRHLHNRKDSKDIGRVISCQQRVEDPAKGLPEVICAADLVKTESIGDFSFFGDIHILFVVLLLWRSPEVAHDLVAFVVQQFNNSPQSDEDSSCCGGVAVSRREEVKLDRVEEPEKNPIMETVDQNSLEWHRFSAEDMNIGCFVLSLQIVENAQDQSCGLHIRVCFLLAEQEENRKDQNRSQVLNIEDHLPSYLFAQIFQDQIFISDLSDFDRHLVVAKHMFGLSIFVGKFLLEDRNLGQFFDFLLDELDGIGLISGDLEWFFLVGNQKVD